MKKLRRYACITVLLPALCHGEVAEIVQTPASNPAPLTIESDLPKGPDESILWSLFHAGKIDTLKRQIANLQARFPAWRVPEDLQTALRQSAKKTSTKIPTRPQKSRTHRRRANACSRINKRWANANAQLDRGNVQTAVKQYADIIGQCKNPKLVKATLEKAGTLPNRADYFRLTALAAGVLPESELQGLNYQWLKNAFLNQPANEYVEPDLLIDIDRFQDADFATLVAWHYFDHQAYREAYAWFDKAERWQANNTDATLGKMLSLEKLGEIDAALAAYPANSTNPNLNGTAGRLYKMKAWQYLNDSNLIQAKQNLNKAHSIVGDTDPEIQQIEAWIADGGKEYAKAATLFDTIYRKTPNADYANAYVRNQSQIDRKVLANRAEQSGGPLLTEYQQLQGRDLYQRKQFLATYDLTPNQFPNLHHIDTPSVDLGVYARHKSGEAGLNRLDILKMPTGGGEFTVGGVHHFRLSLSRMELNAGSPTRCSSLLGSLTPDSQTSCANNFKGPFNPTYKLTDALETNFSYRMDGWFSPYVSLGNTPTGGVIDPTITFDVGFIQQTETGNWGLSVYSQPVRQSILSYTGMRDPYGRLLPNGAWNQEQYEWGRVLRSAVRAGGYHRFNERWGFFGSAEIAMLNGKNVADNTAFAFSINPSFNIPLNGFDYFSIGPALAYEHYEKNLSHFTLGHGGYFSPEHYINAGPSLQFLSEEGKPIVFKGHVSAGIQLIKQSDSPWFPLLAPGLGTYHDNKGFQLSNALDIELKGVWLLAPNIQLGAGAAVRHTSNYQDYTGGLFIRFFFQDRKASYSTDIPNAMFNTIQFY